MGKTSRNSAVKGTRKTKVPEESLQNLQLVETMLNSSNQGFVVWDNKQNLVACSKKCPDFWYDPTDILQPGMPMLELLLHVANKGGFGPGDSDTLARKELRRVRKVGMDSKEEFRLLDGRVIHVQRQSMKGGGHAATYTDITVRKELEDKINYMATHDTLTDIPNRVLFKDRLEQAIERAIREKTKVAILFLDLDNFKMVNDVMGHMIGDKVLRTMAERMTSCLRKTDTVARYGGDEFAIVMTEIKNLDDVSNMAKKLNVALSAPINLGSKETSLGASIGISIYPDHAKTSETLLSLADEAMYVVKKKSKRDHHFSGQT